MLGRPVSGCRDIDLAHGAARALKADTDTRVYHSAVSEHADSFDAQALAEAARQAIMAHQA